MFTRVVCLLRLYTSEQYLCDCLAIFHASYIDDAIMAGDVRQICVGEYFLPPYDLYLGEYGVV